MKVFFYKHVSRFVADTSVQFFTENKDAGSTHFNIPIDNIKELESLSRSEYARVSFILYENSKLFPSNTYQTSQVKLAN